MSTVKLSWRKVFIRSIALCTSLVFLCAATVPGYAITEGRYALRPRAQQESNIAAVVPEGAVRAKIPSAQAGIVDIANITQAADFVAPVLIAPQILELFFSGTVLLPTAEVLESYVAFDGGNQDAFHAALGLLLAEGILVMPTSGQYDLNTRHPAYAQLQDLYSSTSRPKSAEEGEPDIVTENAIMYFLVDNAVSGMTLAELQEQVRKKFFVLDDHVVYVLQRLIASGRAEEHHGRYYVNLADPILLFALEQQLRILFGLVVSMAPPEIPTAASLRWQKFLENYVYKVSVWERLGAGFAFAAAKILVALAAGHFFGAEAAATGLTFSGIAGIFLGGAIAAPLFMGDPARRGDKTERQNVVLPLRQNDEFYMAHATPGKFSNFGLSVYPGEESRQAYEAYRNKILGILVHRVIPRQQTEGIHPEVIDNFYARAADEAYMRLDNPGDSIFTKVVEILDRLHFQGASAAHTAQALSDLNAAEQKKTL
jgi:hypothetical protein